MFFFTQAEVMIRLVPVRHGDIIHPGVAAFDGVMLVRIGGKVGGIVARADVLDLRKTKDGSARRPDREPWRHRTRLAASTTRPSPIRQ